MGKRGITLFMLALLAGSASYSQSDPSVKGMQAISLSAIKAQMGFLASDWTEGREAGTKGEFLAGDYIASMLQLYGVKPAGDIQRGGRNQSAVNQSGERSYFQNFVLIRSEPGEQQALKLRWTEGKSSKITEFAHNVDFTIRPGDQSIETEAPVVFAGYGFVSSKMKYNDLAKLDLKGKFVLRIAGTPKSASAALGASELTAALRESEASIRSAGAVGIIEVNPKAFTVGSPGRKEFLEMSPSEGTARSGRAYANYSIPSDKPSEYIPRIQVSLKAANEILKGSGTDIETFIRMSESGAAAMPSNTSEKTIIFKSTVINTQYQVRNIIGVIEGNKTDQVIVVGAHYDHMGIGNGYLWNGADDNASGTVGVMTIAKAICESGKKPDKTIVIALWTAEEKGLLGSKYWIQNPTYPIKHIKLNHNFDMISRYKNDNEPKKVTLTYTETLKFFKELTEANLRKHNIDLIVDYQPSSDPPGGSDHKSFTAEGIPAMRFMPAYREEYHAPTDELGTIDWDIMEKIIRISYANIWELSNREW